MKCSNCGENMSVVEDIDINGKYMTYLKCYECGYIRDKK